MFGKSAKRILELKEYNRELERQVALLKIDVACHKGDASAEKHFADQMAAINEDVWKQMTEVMKKVFKLREENKHLKTRLKTFTDL